MLRPLLTSALAAGLGLLTIALPACGGGDDPAPDDGSSSGSSGSSGASGASGSSGTSSTGASGTSVTSGTSGASGTTGTSGTSSGTTFSSVVKQGKATFYNYSGAGVVACSFDITSDTNVTAMGDSEYLGSAACGTCLDVAGPKGKITVRVVDRCAGCEAGHIDLSAQAFAKIGDPVAGHVPITYQAVPCAENGNMSYRVKEGSSKYWTAIQVRDHRIPITKVEYLKNGAYTNMPRATYNYFIDTKGVGDQPSGIQMRITAADGQVVTDTIPGPQPSKVFPGTVQFK